MINVYQAWSLRRIFKTGGTDKVLTLAANSVADALAAQGLEVTKVLDGVPITLTNGSTTAGYSSASSTHAGHILIVGYDAENYNFGVYRVASVSAGVSYTLDAAFDGPTGTYDCLLCDGPATEKSVLNPQKKVLGIDLVQRHSGDIETLSSSVVSATLTVT